MSATAHRTPRSGRQSLLFQDLASPISARRGKFSTPSQTAAVSALWRENFGGSDLPPPPMFTLEDRSDFSPESGIADYSVSPGAKSDRTPFQSSGKNIVTPAKGKAEAGTPFSILGARQNQQVSGSPTWWSQSKGGSSAEQDDKGKGSPVEGVVQPGALVTLPPPREVARPEVQRQIIPTGDLEEEEWVTVYGFSPSDTNMVLREFEKCGMILKHIPGPRSANWMHILYENRNDAHKALNKSGMMINGAVIVGVKPVDPIQRQALNERLNTQGFMPLPPPLSRDSEFNSLSRPSSRSHHLQSGNAFTSQPSGAMASPSKSVVSKFLDLMFEPQGCLVQNDLWYERLNGTDYMDRLTGTVCNFYQSWSRDRFLCYVNRIPDQKAETKRAMCLMLSTVAVSLMVTARETSMTFQLQLHDVWSLSDSLIYLGIVSSATALNLLLQLVITGTRLVTKSPVILPTRTQAWFCFAADQILGYAMVSGGSAALGVTNMNRTGIKHMPLLNFCKSLDIFCDHLALSVLFALSAFLLLAASSILDVLRMSQQS